MAHGKRQRNQYRRRLEAKTDYHRRLRMLKSGLPRAVVRVSNTQITCQLANFSKDGDLIVASFTGNELSSHGYPTNASKKSITACYLAAKIEPSDNLLMVLFKLIIATSTIYILGLIWLGTLIGWDKPIFALGAKPFLLAEIFKIMLLALLTKQIIKIKKFI